jgi:light-regulated signal transduction histidine kinase (bacteriophytochrome)
MQSLITALLELSQVSSSDRPPSPVDAGAALDAALDNLGAAIEEGGAEVSHGPLPIVMADATQLTQLFQNLIGNAIKFRGDRRPEIRVEAVARGDEWLLSIRDNGIGIAAAHRDRIFGIFQRLHTREEYPGTGIGLAVCKKIVERSGGRIWVESTPGEGTTFYFTFPRHVASDDVQDEQELLAHAT